MGNSRNRTKKKLNWRKKNGHHMINVIKARKCLKNLKGDEQSNVLINESQCQSGSTSCDLEQGRPVESIPHQFNFVSVSDLAEDATQADASIEDKQDEDLDCSTPQQSNYEIQESSEFNLKLEIEEDAVSSSPSEQSKSDSVEGNGQQICFELEDDGAINQNQQKPDSKHTSHVNAQTYTIHCEKNSNRQITESYVTLDAAPKRYPPGVANDEGHKNQTQFKEAIKKADADTNETKRSKDFDFERFRKLSEWKTRIRNKFKGNYKDIALNIYYASPQTYKLVKPILNLYSVASLYRLREKIPPKLNERVLTSLSLKIKSLPPRAKYCTLCFGETPLKRHLHYDTKADELTGFQSINGKTTDELAGNVCVLMIQGICYQWTQPIAYAFVKDRADHVELSSWIDEVISLLHIVGVEIKAIVSDQNYHMDTFAKTVKNVSIETPYFRVGEQTVYYIFDVPNLLEDIRKILIRSDLNYETGIIKCDYIKRLYRHQTENALRLIPKITEAHFKLNKKQETQGDFAVQVFSRTVSAALETYMAFGVIPEDARETAIFIETMNNVFAVLNSNKVKSAVNLQSAYRDTTEQRRVLEHAQIMFLRLRENREVNVEKTFYNFQITIQSMLCIFRDLKAQGFKHVLTRRLNLSHLEDFFKAVRKRAGKTLTAVKFCKSFSQIFVQHMLKIKTEDKNDFKDILETAENVLFNVCISTHPRDEKVSLVSLDSIDDYRMELPQARTNTYISAYLLYKCFENHKCDEFKKLMKKSRLMLVGRYKDCIKLNVNAPFYGQLRIPPRCFVKYVLQLEDGFARNSEYLILDRPGSAIYESLKNVSLECICPCFPVDFCLKLFVRLRIYTMLKFNQKELKHGTTRIGF